MTVGHMAMDAGQIGPPDTAPPAPGYPGKNRCWGRRKRIEAGNPSALIAPSREA